VCEREREREMEMERERERERERENREREIECVCTLSFIECIQLQCNTLQHTFIVYTTQRAPTHSLSLLV